ncbi:MAG: SRPBCC domain-containing protein, partial [Gillisia sp.]|nr:SRPBCC domain-containing protein [Gillisia sp.]
ASHNWHTPKAENDLSVGGKFLLRMEARDGNSGFDFSGIYDEIKTHKLISYTIDDGRKVKITFNENKNEAKVVETFEAESTNSMEMQREGWQAILDSFKHYVETFGKFEPLHFEKTINANAKKVFETMLDKKQFAVWTAEFNPELHFIGSWEKGSEIIFLGTDEDGNMGGMVSRVKENIPNKFISIEHLGLVQNGKEITSGPEVEGWTGAMEDYTFKEENGKTLVSVDVDVNQEFKSYFLKTWPKALKKLKAICEA